MSNLIFNGSWLQNAIHDIETDLSLLHKLQADMSRLRTVLPDALNVSYLLRESDRLEQSLLITKKALQQFKDDSERNSAKTIADYVEAQYIVAHIFD